MPRQALLSRTKDQWAKKDGGRTHAGVREMDKGKEQKEDFKKQKGGGRAGGGCGGQAKCSGIAVGQLITVRH